MTDFSELAILDGYGDYDEYEYEDDDVFYP